MAYSEGFYDELSGNELKREGFKTFYVPEMIDIFRDGGVKLESVLDVGCGTGMLLKQFADCGITDIFGMDFCEDKNLLEIPVEQFVTTDLNQISEEKNRRKFQLAVCLEVAEHLLESSADSLIKFLVDASDVIWFSAAIPYQGGEGHINEQWPEYWEEKFNRHGYVRVDWFRKKTWDNRDLIGYYRQNMLLYVKEEVLERYPKMKEFYEKYNDQLPKHLVHPCVYLFSARNVSG